jgi:membrane peptidoglycan carboxypeptidase
VPGDLKPARLRGRFSYLVRSADGSRTERASGSGSADWISAANISPFLLHAVLAHEDAAFFRHRGFVTPAIREALVRDLKARRFRQGASTISMQLARNLYLSREKNLARKLQEVILTRWLEETLNKREILELYLNVIEYGPHLHGVRSASRHYFGREPEALSPAESAFLACILPAPHRYHRLVENGRLPESLAGQVRSLLELMTEAGRIDEAARDHGLAEIEAGLFSPAEPGHPGERSRQGSAAPLAWED